MSGFKFSLNKRDQHYWKLINEEGIIVADSGEDSPQEDTCRHGADLFIKHGPHTAVRIVQAPSKENSGAGYDWECFPDKAGKWRWHFQANNNKIIADSGSRTFDTPEEAMERIDRVKKLLLSLVNVPHPDTLSLIVIVSGTPATIVVTPQQLLREVALEALEHTNNTARPLADWTLKTREGRLLNLDKTVGGYGFADQEQLVMSLEAGVGGTN